jgi:predicted AAA+ superfamily ATPase
VILGYERPPRYVPRREHQDAVRRLLRENPVVAVVGARQVGKTTLAKDVARGASRVTWFDCEDPADLARLAQPRLALADLRGLVVIDEVQRRPDLFPVLRVLADRHPLRARFLILGSAAPELLRQSSETLAGRIAYHELGGLAADEVGPARAGQLWLRGGFPRSFTAKTATASFAWRTEFVRTFLERDIPQFGSRIPAPTLHRFWTMMAHCHGQILNWSELGRSMGVTDHAVRGYTDLLENTFMLRLLKPWFENISKRQVKAPKMYLRDSGLLHALLDVRTKVQLERSPKVGASWEGFCIEAIVFRRRLRPEECFFWATHSGAELDLLVVRGGKKYGYEIKFTDEPALTPSMRIALEDLGLESLDVIHAGGETFPLGNKVRAVAMELIWRDVE